MIESPNKRVVITNPGAINYDSPTAERLPGTSIEAMGFFHRTQEQVKRADGSYVLTSAIVKFDPDTPIRMDSVVTVDGVEYSVLAITDVGAWYGVLDGVKVSLQ
jgi:hypothetical protein